VKKPSISSSKATTAASRLAPRTTLCDVVLTGSAEGVEGGLTAANVASDFLKFNSK
jgi:hypothetical protein